MSDVYDRLGSFLQEVENMEVNQKASAISRENLENRLRSGDDTARTISDELNVLTSAVSILSKVSDESVQSSYKFMEENINPVLERIFIKSKRKIELREYTRNGMYPQLEIILHTESGVRSLKDDSGHGIGQIISLLCVLSLIVITGKRRILGMDEIISGLSAKSLEIVDSIMWVFAELGFQFIVTEHGFIPKGAQVYVLEMNGGVAGVMDEYIEPNGVYPVDGIERAKRVTTDKEKEYDGTEDYDEEEVEPNMEVQEQTNSSIFSSGAVVDVGI